MNLCDYGCEREAKFKFKNEKWCCSEFYQSCPAFRKRSSNSHLGQVVWNKNLTKEIDDRVKKVAEKLIGRTKETHEGVRRAAEKMKGRINHQKGKKLGPYNEDRKKKMRKKKTFTRESLLKKKELAKIQCLNGHITYINSLPKMGYKNHKEWMENGGAAYLNSFIQNPSKTELELRKIVDQLLPYVIHNYPIYRIGKGRRSYNVDNAISKLGLIIEFDGWYHFDTEEHKEYHRKRQQEIEEEGWNFLRYNIFQSFPTLEQLKEDIQKLIKGSMS